MWLRWTLLIGLGLVACATGDDATGSSDDTSTTAVGQGGAGGQGGGQGGQGGETVTVGSGGGSPEVTEVFGHSGTELFRLDPITLEVTSVGAFTNCGPNSVLDIALDKDSNLWAVKRRALYRVERDTAACILVNQLPMMGPETYPDSLSFVPAGTLDANNEALVGYADDQYVRIDPTSGAITVENPTALTAAGVISSGDIVSVIDGPTYLTVKDGPCDATDCIIEVNPATGELITDFGDVGYNDVFGLGFWGGRVYGFSVDGVLFEVTFGATSVTSTEVPFPAAPMGLAFFGAGSSTAAPVDVPK